MAATLLLGDCLERMADVEDASVDAIVTSPPYDGIRRYGSGADFDLEGVAAHCHRVLAPGGVLVWVVNDQSIDGGESGTSFRQALYFQSIGLRIHDTMIFEKANPPPLNHPRYEQAFEFMFVLSKGRPKTVNLLREPCRSFGKMTTGPTRRRGAHSDELVPTHSARNPVSESKPRTNIWKYGVGSRRIEHPATFPLQLATDHVLSWTNPGDIVLDTFMGSGTTGVACINTGRRFIGVERDAGYFATAEARIAEAEGELPLLAAR